MRERMKTRDFVSKTILYKTKTRGTLSLREWKAGATTFLWCAQVSPLARMRPLRPVRGSRKRWSIGDFPMADGEKKLLPLYLLLLLYLYLFDMFLALVLSLVSMVVDDNMSNVSFTTSMSVVTTCGSGPIHIK